MTLQKTEDKELGMLDMVEGGKSSFSKAILPTGLLDENKELHKEVLLSEMTGREEDILSSSRMTASQKTATILENCIQQIGKYDQKHEKFKHYVKSLSLNDRLFLLIEIRIISLGKMFDFKITCPKCLKTSNQTVSLGDFKVQGLTDPYAQEWEGILPSSKKKYKCQIQTGYQEEKHQDLLKSDEDIMSLIIMSRLKELEGKPVSLEDVKKLSLRDRNHLRSQMKKSEGSIDNEVEMNCPHCKHEFKTEIDIGNPSFFFPLEV